MNESRMAHLNRSNEHGGGIAGDTMVSNDILKPDFLYHGLVITLKNGRRATIGVHCIFMCRIWIRSRSEKVRDQIRQT